MLLGVALILASTFAYNGSAVLLATETRRHAGDSALLLAVGRQASGAFAISMNLLGWALEVAALTLIPLTLARVLNAAGLVVLLGMTRWALKESFGRREALGVGLVALGIVAVGYAPPDTGNSSPGFPQYVLLFALLAPGILAPGALRLLRRSPGAALTATAAGLAYAMSGILNKSVAHDLHVSKIPSLALLMLCIVALGLWGFATELNALRDGRVSVVVPIVLALHTVVPIVFAPFLFGESWPTELFARVILGGGIALTILGTLALTGSGNREPDGS
ncbi:MAG TPA: hypothetical protein VFJ72_08770 [Rubrobacteraceae bacterium]|nr:hypothetical protein [Rubrobacteraceae bacterium]